MGISRAGIDNRLAERALALIGFDGMIQSELSRLLGISSSRCSRIVCRLERQGLVKRSKITFRGRRTYLIRRCFSTSSLDRYLAELYVLFLLNNSGEQKRRRSSI